MNNNILDDIVNIKKHKDYQNTIGLYTEMLADETNWYSRNKVDLFLKDHVEELQLPKDKKTFDDRMNDNFKEIIIACYTNEMRPIIYSVIEEIEIHLNNFKYSDKKGKFNIPVAIVVCGGDGFNNFFSNKDKDNRLVSPDIDVKLQILTDEAIRVHKYMYEGKKKTYDKLNVSLKEDQIQVKKQILLVRNELYSKMIKVAKKLEKIHLDKNDKSPYNSIALNRMYKNLNKYCKRFSDCKKIFLLDNFEEDDVQSEEKKFKYDFSNNKNDINYQVRYTLMKRGNIDNSTKEDPYKLHDVHLYAFDLSFKDVNPFQSIAGLLDIVISYPGHMGYMYSNKHFKKRKIDFNFQLDSNDIELKKISIKNVHFITEKYYIQEVVKQIMLGLRTKTKKIKKDLSRFIILLKYYNSNKGINNKERLKLSKTQLSNISFIVNKLSNKDKKFKEDCIKLYENIKLLSTNEQTGGSNEQNISFKKSFIALGKLKLNYPFFSEDSGYSSVTSKQNKNNYTSIDKNVKDEKAKSEVDDMFKIELAESELQNAKSHIKTNYDKNFSKDCLNKDIKYINYIKVPKLLHYIGNDLSLNLSKCKVIEEGERSVSINYEVKQRIKEKVIFDDQDIDTEYLYSIINTRIDNKVIQSWASTENNDNYNNSNINIVKKICSELTKLLKSDNNNIIKLCYGYEDINTKNIDIKQVAKAVLNDSHCLNLPKLYINNKLSSGVVKDLNNPYVKSLINKLDKHQITTLYKTIKDISEGKIVSKRKRYEKKPVCIKEKKNEGFSLF